MQHGVAPEVPAVLILANKEGVRRVPIGAIGKDTMIDLKPAAPHETTPLWVMPPLRNPPNTIPLMLAVGAVVYHYGGFWGVFALVVLHQLGRWKR